MGFPSFSIVTVLVACPASVIARVRVSVSHATIHPYFIPIAILFADCMEECMVYISPIGILFFFVLADDDGWVRWREEKGGEKKEPCVCKCR